MDTNRFHLNLPILILVFLLALGAGDCGMRLLTSSNPVTGINNPLLNYPNLFQGTGYWNLKSSLHLEIVDAPVTFTIDTNAYGMRMGEVNWQKPEGKIRVAVMGDSVAFGWGVSVEESFPSVLQQRLGDGYDVLNFSGPEYTTFHGLKQYEELVHNAKPDVLILAFGLYDSHQSKLSEEEYYDLLMQSGLESSTHGFGALLDRCSYVYHRWANRQRENAVLEFAQTLNEKKTGNAWKRKVETVDLEENLNLVIEHQLGQGGKAVLLHGNLLNFEILPALRTIAARWSIPLLDVRDYFDQVGQFQFRTMRNDIGLERPGMVPSAEPRYLFRVAVPQGSQITPPLYVVGNHEALGNGAFNSVRLYDDGTHGDERRNDQIWSVELPLAFQEPLYYTFYRHFQSRGGRNALPLQPYPPQYDILPSPSA